MHRAPFTLNWGRFGVSRQVGLYAKSSASTVSLDSNSSSNNTSYSTLSKSQDRIPYTTTPSSSLSWRARSDCTLVHARMSTPTSLFSTGASSGLPTSTSASTDQAIPFTNSPQTKGPRRIELRRETRDQVASMTEEMLQAKRAGKYSTVLKLFRMIQVLSHQQAPLLAFNIVFDTFSLGSFPAPPPSVTGSVANSTLNYKPSPSSLPLQDLLTCYGELIRATHITPAPFTYSCLLKALAMRCRTECRALLHAAEDGDVALATDDPQSVPPPSSPSSSSTAPVELLCESNDTVRSLTDILVQVYGAMQQRGFVRDIGVNTHNQVLRSAAEAGHLKLAMRVFDALEECPTQTPNEHTYSFLILALGRSGEMTAARRCYDAFLSGSRSPDACTFVANHLIDVLTQRGGAQLDEARRLLDVEMPASGVRVDVVGLNTLITAYGREKRVREAWELTRAMAHPDLHDRYPSPDIVTLRTLLSMAIREADAPVAYWAWKEMCPNEPGSSTTITNGTGRKKPAHEAVLGIRRTIRLLRLMLQSGEVDAICGILSSIRSPSALRSSSPSPQAKDQDPLLGLKADLKLFLSRPDTTPDAVCRVLTSLSPMIMGLKLPQINGILMAVQRAVIPKSTFVSGDDIEPAGKLSTEKMLIVSKWLLAWFEVTTVDFNHCLARSCVLWAKEDPEWLNGRLQTWDIIPSTLSAALLFILRHRCSSQFSEEERIEQARLLLTALFHAQKSTSQKWWWAAIVNPLRKSETADYVDRVSEIYSSVFTHHFALKTGTDAAVIVKWEKQLDAWLAFSSSGRFPSGFPPPTPEEARELFDWLIRLERWGLAKSTCETIMTLPAHVPHRSELISLALSVREQLKEGLANVGPQDHRPLNAPKEWGYGIRGSYLQARKLMAIQDPEEAVKFGWEVLRASNRFRESAFSRTRDISPPSGRFAAVMLGRIVQASSAPTDPPLEKEKQADRVSSAVLKCVDELKRWKTFRFSPIAYSTAIGACLRPASSPEVQERGMELYKEFLTHQASSKDGCSVYGVVAQAAAMRGDQSEALRILGQWRNQRKQDGSMANRNILRVASICHALLSPRDLKEAESFVRQYELEAGGTVEEAWSNIAAGWVLEGDQTKARSLWREMKARDTSQANQKTLKATMRLGDPWDQTLFVLTSLFGEESDELKKVQDFLPTLTE
ncbi:hypothetical protein BJ684DRAFT_20654 [Piptocephalis cylindrospora]|uniref:Pentatricopeptide repeat-containing protein-mitochondrial domain-containing protein n=1 Tax=Piptocephalis cylindrospora TaxID=1907219 RepID=A0A4P9Y2B2_9FUNG|nr:hypothetical protein BJ684DRAFT_20654 [Piptocephalis cylindrospora]|eukprot:RKP12824.1 hypothetical protein BJ684DRAFT_20654 [Piptocephalis cylindrospora]